MVGRCARAALAGLLVLVASGCGDGRPDDPVEAALEATVEAGTARFELESVAEGFQLRETTVTRANGAVDFRANRRRTFLEVELIEGPAQLPAGVIERGEILVDGTDRYVQSAGDDRWVLYDDDVAVPPRGPPTGRDTVELLEGLRHVTSEAEEAGEEDVRGTSTTRYEVTVDLTGGDEERFGEHLSEVPAEVWVDADQRIRRLSYTAEVPEHEPAEDEGAPPRPTGVVGTVTMTVELFDFGADVDVDPPPADAVQPAEDVEPPEDGPPQPLDGS